MSKLWRRLVFRRGRFERELAEEMRFHLLQNRPAWS